MRPASRRYWRTSLTTSALSISTVPRPTSREVAICFVAAAACKRWTVWACFAALRAEAWPRALRRIEDCSARPLREHCASCRREMPCPPRAQLASCKTLANEAPLDDASRFHLFNQAPCRASQDHASTRQATPLRRQSPHKTARDVSESRPLPPPPRRARRSSYVAPRGPGPGPEISAVHPLFSDRGAPPPSDVPARGAPPPKELEPHDWHPVVDPEAQGTYYHNPMTGLVTAVGRRKTGVGAGRGAGRRLLVEYRHGRDHGHRRAVPRAPAAAWARWSTPAAAGLRAFGQPQQQGGGMMSGLGQTMAQGAWRLGLVPLAPTRSWGPCSAAARRRMNRWTTSRAAATTGAMVGVGTTTGLVNCLRCGQCAARTDSGVCSTISSSVQSQTVSAHRASSKRVTAETSWTRRSLTKSRRGARRRFNFRRDDVLPSLYMSGSGPRRRLPLRYRIAVSSRGSPPAWNDVASSRVVLGS